MKNEEFYIGWIAKQPKGIAKFIRKYLLALTAVVISIAFLSGLFQKKFSTGNFEFGTLTQVKGIYFDKPVPNIKVINGKDIWGIESILTLPLIGYGKHGAEGTIADIEKEKNISLNGREVTMKGTLLYNDGKLLMQIDPNDKPLINAVKTEIPSEHSFSAKDLGTLNLKGEIVDPKCFFGVMKPGEGKPHQDCAIRCILGGIPPVLKVTDEDGRQNYYLIVGANGEQINEIVKDFVAEPVEINAKAVQYNDWIVLYVEASDGIRQYSYLHDHYKNGLLSCSATCLK
jgi:hypothetical protein